MIYQSCCLSVLFETRSSSCPGNRNAVVPAIVRGLFEARVSSLRLRGGQASSLEWPGYEKRRWSVDSVERGDTTGLLVCCWLLDIKVRCVES